MQVKGAKTIEEFKQIRNKKIESWINKNFVPGSIVWEMSGANAIKITDKKNDSMIISLNEVN